MLHSTDSKKIEHYLHSLDIWKEEWEATRYIDNSLGRIIKTFGLLTKYVTPGCKILELGASPYYMTVLLRKFTDYQVWVTDFLEETDTGKERDISIYNKNSKKNITIHSHFLNLEKDPLPFESNSFDAVLCCEILEHLILDPAWMLFQIHRVLKKDTGILILTTPNVVRLENIIKLIRKESVYHPYSGYGIYGRHNKEYSPAELKELLTALNFRLLDFKTGKYKTDTFKSRSLVHKIKNSLATILLTNRQEALFVVGQPYGDSRPAFPTEIYSHMHVFSRFIYYYDNNIGDEAELSCTDGWYDLEKWNTGYHRWTKKEATIILKNNGNKTLAIIAFFGGSQSDRFSGSLYVNGELLRQFEVSGNWWRQLDGRLQEKHQGPDLKITIKLDQTWNPGGEYAREIGIAVRSVHLVE